MNYQKTLILENALYHIETLDNLAIITFKSDAPLEELYKLDSSHAYFNADLGEISGKDINTRLFLFSEDIFEENRF